MLDGFMLFEEHTTKWTRNTQIHLNQRDTQDSF